ncbi:hypothetical protein Gotur_009050, partial [Gossypium turneri]
MSFDEEWRKKLPPLLGNGHQIWWRRRRRVRKWRTSRSCHRHFGLTATSCWWVVGSVKLWFSVAYLP